MGQAIRLISYQHHGVFAARSGRCNTFGLNAHRSASISQNMGAVCAWYGRLKTARAAMAGAVPSFAKNVYPRKIIRTMNAGSPSSARTVTYKQRKFAYL